MIPVVDGNENVRDLHPVLAARVAALCADPRVSGLKVESAVRTYAEQKYLYDGYMAGRPGFNLAANPDRTITPAYGLIDPRGSWHMQQGDGYGYAVDFNYSALHPSVQGALEDVAREYLLVRTVPSESWHYQMAWGDWWSLPAEEDDMPYSEDELKSIVREVVQKELGGTNARLNNLQRDVNEIKTATDAELLGKVPAKQGSIRGKVNAIWKRTAS